MSITVTHDVFCDGCGNWTEGVTNGTATEVRAVAKARGWERRRTAPSRPHRSGPAQLIDLCPECQNEAST